MNVSRIALIFNTGKLHMPHSIDNGHVDSIRNLINHENFIKPYSDEHTLVHLLTKSF